MIRNSYVKKQGVVLAALMLALLLWAVPAVHADSDGHIGGKPDIGQGDGIPQTKPGRIQAGEGLQTGDSNQGDDPAQDGGDCIPNEGPIEGEEHGQGNFGFEALSAYLAYLLFM